MSKVAQVDFTAKQHLVNIKYYFLLINDYAFISEKLLTMVYSAPGWGNSLNCFIQTSLWIFYMCSNLFSTILITIDRYIYINKCMKYNIIMTKELTVFSIFSAWIMSLIISIVTLTIQFESSHMETRCIFSHNVPVVFTAFFATIIVLVLIVVYILYAKILVKFYKKRKRLQKAKQQQQESVR